VGSGETQATLMTGSPHKHRLRQFPDCEGYRIGFNLIFIYIFIMKKNLTKEQKLKKKVAELREEIKQWQSGERERVDTLDLRVRLRDEIVEKDEEIRGLRKSRDNEIYLRGRIEGMREVLKYQEGTPEAGDKNVYYGEESYDRSYI